MRPHKYHAVRTEVDGISFPSKAEAARYRELVMLADPRTSEPIRGFMRQPCFTLGCPENRYRPDFLVFNGDGTVHAEDIKGVELPAFRKNVKLWERYGPCKLVIMSRSGERWKRREVGQ